MADETMGLEARCRNCGNTGISPWTGEPCGCKHGKALAQMAETVLDEAKILPSRCRCCGKYRRDCTCRYGGSDEPRAIIRHFAAAMERKLAANDGMKGGWRDADIDVLQRLMHGEMREFVQALDVLITCQLTGAPDELLVEAREALRDEAADVANCLMFIVDAFGGLPPTDERGR